MDIYNVGVGVLHPAYTHGDFLVLPHWSIYQYQATITMTRYLIQSHFHDTQLTLPYPINVKHQSRKWEV